MNSNSTTSSVNLPTAESLPTPSLREKMAQGRFVVTAEMVPPRTPDLANISNRLEKYFRGNCDAVNVTDCASALLRMSSGGASQVCVAHGLEPVMQITCRDRNRIALQSELLTAHAWGVRNILCLTGDHVTFGDHATAKPVFDMDSTNLIATVAMMREGRFASGEPLKNSPKGEAVAMDWLIGGAANPYGNDPEILALHMEKKMRAGCDFLQTQPIYDYEGFEAWWRAMDARGLTDKIRIMPGLLPPKSAKGLAFMKKEVPGINVPDDVLRRMEQADDAKAEGRKMTLETLDFLLQFPIAGLHVYPVYYETYVPELVGEIRSRAAKAGFTISTDVPTNDTHA